MNRQLEFQFLNLPANTIDIDGDVTIAGVDEVGRGALFGPVVAAAVILPPWAYSELVKSGVTDSKRLLASDRLRLAQQIRAVALDCKIGIASVREIDRLNILRATLLSMKRAVVRLSPQPSFCLVDGNQRIRDLPIFQQTLVKGDQKSLAIAAASIVAKVWRDQLIVRLSTKYPGYDLATNKGYGTAKHRAAMQTLGVSPQHRLSFSPCRAAKTGLINATDRNVQTTELLEENNDGSAQGFASSSCEATHIR